MDSFGFLKVAAAMPHVRVGDCDFNTERIAAMAEEAAQRGVEIVAFPELAVTAYTCADLLLQAAREKTGAQNARILLAENQTLYLGAGRRCGYGMIAFLGRPFPTTDAYFRMLL